MWRGGAAFFVRTPAPRGKNFGHGGGGRGGGVGRGLRRGARDVASPTRRFARRRRGVGRRGDGARACVRRLSDGCAPRFAQRRGAPRRAVSAGRMHRWRGARVKLLTEATCLQDAVPPRLERYLLRGRTTSRRRTSRVVSRRTSTGGARDDEFQLQNGSGLRPENRQPARQKGQNLRGIPRVGAFRRRGETLARELGGRAIPRWQSRQRKGQP